MSLDTLGQFDDHEAQCLLNLSGGITSITVTSHRLGLDQTPFQLHSMRPEKTHGLRGRLDGLRLCIG